MQRHGLHWVQDTNKTKSRTQKTKRWAIQTPWNPWTLMLSKGKQFLLLKRHHLVTHNRSRQHTLYCSSFIIYLLYKILWRPVRSMLWFLQSLCSVFSIWLSSRAPAFMSVWFLLWVRVCRSTIYYVVYIIVCTFITLSHCIVCPSSVSDFPIVSSNSSYILLLYILMYVLLWQQ